MKKEKYNKILETYEASSKIDRLILIDLLRDFLAYNSWVKVERKGVNYYYFNKYFTRSYVNKFDRAIDNHLTKEEQKEALKTVVLSVTWFSKLEKDEVFWHIPLEKARKFTEELSEEKKKEEVWVPYIRWYRDMWTRILSDFKVLRISKYKYLPKEATDEIKEYTKTEDKENELLNYYQWIIKKYEDDLSRDFFDDQNMMSQFYKKSVLRIAFKTGDVRDLLNLIETKETKQLRYNPDSWSFIYDGNIIHTFVVKKWVKNYKKMFTEILYKREKGTYIKYSEILFELWMQDAIYDDMSKSEIDFVERTKDKVNQDIKRKTKDDEILLFSQEKLNGKQYIYRNY